MIPRTGPTTNKSGLAWVSLRAHPPSHWRCRTHEDRHSIRSEAHALASNSALVPKLTDMSTWNGRTGQDGLRSFTDEDGNFWLEQNASKTSKWAKFAKQGHDVAWEVRR